MDKRDWLLQAYAEEARKIREMSSPFAQDLTMRPTVPYVLTEDDLVFLKVNRISPE